MGQKLVLMRRINLNSINTSSTWHSQDLNLVAVHIFSPLGRTPGKGALLLGPAVGNRSASLQERGWQGGGGEGEPGADRRGSGGPFPDTKCSDVLTSVL